MSFRSKYRPRWTGLRGLSATGPYIRAACPGRLRCEHGLARGPVPSITHQWLLVWAARRMTKDGFVVSGFDGRAPRGEEWSSLPRPFLHQGVRADAWGQHARDQLIAFGEAKTFGDIDTV